MLPDTESKDLKRGRDCQWQVSKKTFLSVVQPFWLKTSCRVIFPEGPAAIQNEGFHFGKKAFRFLEGLSAQGWFQFICICKFYDACHATNADSAGFIPGTSHKSGRGFGHPRDPASIRIL